MSSIDESVPPLKPSFDPTNPQAESSRLKQVIEYLGLQPHIEGGYFVETDRDTLRVPNPFLERGTTQGSNDDAEKATRSASTTIHYLLTPKSSLGAFHRNRGRTVHTLHQGRGRYVIIHANEVAAPSCPKGYGSDDVLEEQRWQGKAKIETFTVGQDVLKGEKLQWIVDGGKYKTSFLLPDEEGGDASEGLLISETVVPGFEYEDHDFMKAERMTALVTKEQAEEMWWMLRKV
ncbi:hypothetical protein LTR86_000113 [Recurvomyces mirabilis]|nr:hypothetical protein LTR86_000113 [Recurvomyces mirabilis]